MNEKAYHAAVAALRELQQAALKGGSLMAWYVNDVCARGLQDPDEPDVALRYTTDFFHTPIGYRYEVRDRHGRVVHHAYTACASLEAAIEESKALIRGIRRSDG